MWYNYFHGNGLKLETGHYVRLLAEQRAHRARPGCQHWLGHAAYCRLVLSAQSTKRLEGKLMPHSLLPQLKLC